MSENAEEQVCTVEKQTIPPVGGRGRSWFYRSWLYRKMITTVLHINDTPEAIALGVGLGLFIAMTPTVGLQMVLVLVVHTLFRANRLAGLVMVYISNPFTLVPIYWLDYVAGSVVLGRPLYSYEAFAEQARLIRELAFRWEFWEVTREFVEVSGDLFGPMLLGGAVIGAVLAVPAYFITLGAVRRHRAHKAAKHDGGGTDASA